MVLVRGHRSLCSFTVFTKDVCLANEDVANAFIATFTIAGLGSMITNPSLKGEVSQILPVAAIMMTVFLIDLYFAAARSAPDWQETTLNGPVFSFPTGLAGALPLTCFLPHFRRHFAGAVNAIMQTVPRRPSARASLPPTTSSTRFS